MSTTSPVYSPTFAADPRTTSCVTEAVSQLLAAKDCPSKFRPLVDYLLGVAAGSTDAVWPSSRSRRAPAAINPGSPSPMN